MRIVVASVAIAALISVSGCAKGDKGDQGSAGPAGPARALAELAPPVPLDRPAGARRELPGCQRFPEGCVRRWRDYG